MTDKIKVFYVTASCRIGGAEASLLRLIEGLQANHPDIQIAGACCLEEPGALKDRLEAKGISATCLSVKQKDLLFPGTYGRVREILKSASPDIVQIFGLRAEVATRRQAKTLGAKVVSSIRSPDPWRRAHHVWLDRRTEKYVDGFVSNSKIGMWSRVVREGFAPERIEVIYNGIPAPPEYSEDEKQALREMWGIAGCDPVIAMIANLRSMKGYPAAIEAVAGLKEKYPNIALLCAGRDDSNGEIPALARKLGVEGCVRFLGYVENVNDILAVTDCFLLPSSWEGCPTSILEAQAMGVPVIANNAGGIPELVLHEQTGMLLHADLETPVLDLSLETPNVRETVKEWLKPREAPVDEIITAVNRLLSDARLRTRLAAAARERALTDYSLDRMADRHAAYYKQIL